MNGADCILHVEHHPLREDCLMAVLAWAVRNRGWSRLSLHERYCQDYEAMAWGKAIEEVERGADLAPDDPSPDDLAPTKID